jgi:hypothetical protein
MLVSISDVSLAEPTHKHRIALTYQIEVLNGPMHAIMSDVHTYRLDGAGSVVYNP